MLLLRRRLALWELSWLSCSSLLRLPVDYPGIRDMKVGDDPFYGLYGMGFNVGMTINDADDYEVFLFCYDCFGVYLKLVFSFFLLGT